MCHQDPEILMTQVTQIKTGNEGFNSMQFARQKHIHLTPPATVSD